MEKMKKLVENYNEKLAEKGIKCSASKRFYEEEVGERHNNYGLIERQIDKKREKKYRWQRNRYHVIILKVEPVDKSLVKKEYCREYAFLLSRVYRAHIGMEPKAVFISEETVLKMLEARLQKILKKAGKHSVCTVCRDTWRDVAFRYMISGKYGYKKKALGKDMYFWNTLFLGIAGIVTLVAVGIAWVTSISW